MRESKFDAEEFDRAVVLEDFLGKGSIDLDA